MSGLENKPLGYDVFMDLYKPIENTEEGEDYFIWDFCDEVKKAAEEGRVCTVRHGDGCEDEDEEEVWTIDAGVGVVNRVGYMITRVSVPADLIVEY